MCPTSLLVGSFVLYARCDLPNNTTPIITKLVTDIQHLRQISLFTFDRSRSKFKVKTAVLKFFDP